MGMNEQLQQTLLSQLKDVHSPEAITWWPVAFGWWVLLLLSLATISVCVFFLWRRYQQNRYRKIAILELNRMHKRWLESSNDQAYIASANVLLKRIIRILEPSALNQSSDTWVDTLDRYHASLFSKETRHALAYQCYQAQTNTDINSLHIELRRWIKQHSKAPKTNPKKVKHA